MQKSDFVFSIEELKKYLQEKGFDTKKILWPEKNFNNKFDLILPKFYVDMINWYDENDPLRKMNIPSREEENIKKYEVADPIGDLPHSPVPGIVHRYPNRVLLNLTQICAVHCRFCFRKNLLGKHVPDFWESINYIKNRPEIWEVIFSGGDPFTLTDEFLELALKNLREIPHVKMIRFHTRTPVVYPQRVTENFLRVLENARPFSVVIHINHPREISSQFVECIEQLKKAGALVLSQSVLMKDVNNSSQTLKELFEKLAEICIKPYYLHHLDFAAGTNYFRVSVEEGKRIMQELHGNISGICMPQYVIDVPLGMGKIPVMWFERISEKDYKAKNFQGKEIVYTDPCS